MIEPGGVTFDNRLVAALLAFICHVTGLGFRLALRWNKLTYDIVKEWHHRL